MIALVRHLKRSRTGTMAVETALVAPILAMMAIGIFEVGTLVSRQQELQSAANEAESIIMAASAGSGVSSTKLKDMLAASTQIPASDITLAGKYRCGNSSQLYDSASSCSTGQQVYQFVQATFTGTYTPTWANYGISKPINYSVTRLVQVG
ncbi:TadE/TadG family type IV pilus assembly protein [Tsuneonella mangrovi]|uniref:TadE/TadG family type IV pilus assembly protein n=1 Tax=Tsuneonella mangrovi TaxID=1982042 RepID=UPI000BA25504|nr:TadE/TadG family type IV pilus assembly protein [Tsuneonella mangrovi]